MLEAVAKDVRIECLAGHYHNTHGMAIADLYASYRLGLRTFDSAVAALGGCPHTKGGDRQHRDRECCLSSKGDLVTTMMSISARCGAPPGSKPS
jgi:hypothetical protein